MQEYLTSLMVIIFCFTALPVHAESFCLAFSRDVKVYNISELFISQKNYNVFI